MTVTLQEIKAELETVSAQIADLEAVSDTLSATRASLAEEMSTVVKGEDVGVDNDVAEIVDLLVVYNVQAQKFVASVNDLFSTTNTDNSFTLVTEPNWYQLVAQFQSFLSTKSAWKDTFSGSVGQTLSELIASNTMMLLNGIGVAQRESFLQLAKRPSSIYAGVEMMGTSIPRKVPAGTTATLTRSDFEQIVFNNVQLVSTVFPVEDDGTPVLLTRAWTKVVSGTTTLNYGEGVDEYTIDGSSIVFGANSVNKFFTITVDFLPESLEVPKYSVFTINGIKFFNRELIVFQEGVETVTSVLYEGLPKTYTEAAVEAGFQVIRLPDSNFTVSEKDVVVRVSENATTVKWSEAENGLWSSSQTNVYLERTTGFGDTHIIFGDGTYGNKPLQNSLLYVDYVVTSGAVANQNNLGLKVGCTAFPSIKGVTTTKIGEGSDEKSADTYKTIGSDIFDSKSTIIRHKDYVAHTLNWPNVSDVVVKAQKDIAPDDMSWMNTIRFCILPKTGDVLTDSEWEALASYFDEHAHASLMWVKVDPVPYDISISLTIYVFEHVVVQDIKETIRKAVTGVFDRNPGIIGRTVSISDIMGAARISGSVDWLEILINGDSRDIPMPDAYTYARLKSLELTMTVSTRK